MRALLQRLYTILGSRRFFWAVLAFFILQASWITLSAVYPMAFDEDFHLGIIKIYSHHLLPFLSQQPAGANIYGPVTHDPSYLYQYLMSFPYRVIELFTKDQTIQVIWLRFINIALFAYALVIFRRFLLRTNVSAAFTNTSMLLFVLIPIVPLLAATINYDNLTMVVVAWAALLVVDIIPALQSKRIPLRDIGILVTLCLLGVIVKYAFLPIAAGCVITVIALWWHTFRGDIWKGTTHAIRTDYARLGLATKVILPVLFLISLGLFSQRYLVNLIDYGAPIPACDKVLTVKECMSYGPWARNHDFAQHKHSTFHANPVVYLPQWLYGMWYRLFFAVNGNVSIPSWARYESFPPLPLPSVSAIMLTVATLALVLRYWRKIFHGDWMVVLCLMITIFYIGALFATDFANYKRTGWAVAVNGRYLLPILLPIAIIASRAWRIALRHRPPAKIVMACVAILLFLQGGGVLTFMMRSNYAWYWPNHTVQSANRTAQKVAWKVVVGYWPIQPYSP